MVFYFYVCKWSFKFFLVTIIPTLTSNTHHFLTFYAPKTWYPWSSDGDSLLAFFHFLFSMFCYDGFLTYVLLVKCALLADLCVDSKERNKLNNYSAWFSFAGSSLAMTAYYTWDEDNLFAFRVSDSGILA